MQQHESGPARNVLFEGRANVGVQHGAEGSASDEAHPTEENQRADEGGH